MRHEASEVGGSHNSKPEQARASWLGLVDQPPEVEQMHKLIEQVNVVIGRVMTLSLDDLKRQEGQGATEYGLVIAFVVLSIALTIGLMGAAITGFLGRVAGKLNLLVP
jgi:Flp pilus assembly pilin Flp